MDEERTFRRDGFTLVELLIVVSVMALVVTAIAATFMIIVRANPSNVERADDSRALTNLTRWLPDDVASTFATPHDLAEARPSGFALGSSSLGDAPQCVTESSPDRVSLLNLSWTENTTVDGATTYFVDYFWVRDGAQEGGLELGRVQRFSCFGTIALGAVDVPEVLDMSGRLSELPGSQVPVQVVPTFPPFLNSGTWTDSPEPGTWQPDGTTSVVGGVTFTVSLWDDREQRVRDLLELSAVTKNVQGPDLSSSDGGGGGAAGPSNEPPVAGNLTVEMNPATAATATFSLPVFDYDGTIDQLVVAVGDPSVPSDPVLWEVEFTFDDASGQHEVTITVPADAARVGHSFGFSVTDRGGEGLSDTGLITVNVTDSSDLADPIVELPEPPDPPCAVAFDSVVPLAPQTVELAKSKNNPTNEINTLKNDIDVTITRSGACGSLFLRFNPLGDDGSATSSFAAATELRIRKNEYEWRVGERVLELVEVVTDPATGDPRPEVRDSVVLTVVPAP